MKGLRITNIILFALICAAQAFAIYVIIACLIPLISGNAGGLLAVFLALVPIYMLVIAGIFILTIVLTITTKTLTKKLQGQELSPNKFDKLCKILPWIFVIFDLIMLVVIFILGKTNN